jgi:hypothetical protein
VVSANFSRGADYYTITSTATRQGDEPSTSCHPAKDRPPSGPGETDGPHLATLSPLSSLLTLPRHRGSLSPPS